VIIPEANALKSFGGKVFLDFNHEYDAKTQTSKGTPQEFAAAWRHIWTVFKNQGVTNAIWVWTSTGWTGNASTILAGWPGASYVDWIGYDPYSLGACAGRTWHSSFDTFAPYYQWVQGQSAMAGKPMILTEYSATANDPRVKDWYASIPATLAQLPRLKALIQYSDTSPTGCDLKVTDSSGAMAGFAKAANSPLVTGG
jgi:beta-mannanase